MSRPECEDQGPCRARRKHSGNDGNGVVAGARQKAKHHFPCAEDHRHPKQWHGKGDRSELAAETRSEMDGTERPSPGRAQPSNHQRSAENEQRPAPRLIEFTAVHHRGIDIDRGQSHPRRIKCLNESLESGAKARIGDPFFKFVIADIGRPDHCDQEAPEDEKNPETGGKRFQRLCKQRGRIMRLTMERFQLPGSKKRDANAAFGKGVPREFFLP